MWNYEHHHMLCYILLQFLSLNTNTISTGGVDDPVPSLAEVQKAAADCGWLDINVDSSGTNSTWSVCRQKVE